MSQLNTGLELSGGGHRSSTGEEAPNTNPSSKMPTRIPELDGIRGMAIAMVLYVHFFGNTITVVPASLLSRALATFRLAWTGVDLFFVLSGFLIGGILLDARESTNYFKVFYVRRFLRIVPIYAAVLLIFPTLQLAARVVHHGDYSWLSANSLPWYSFWTFTQNFWMIRSHSLGGDVLGVTWSLAIEEQFYLTLPLIIRFFSGQRLLILVLSGICLAPVLRMVLLLISPDNALAAFVLMPCRADALLFGVLAAILLRKEQTWNLLRRSGLYFALLIFSLLSGMAFLTLKSPGPNSPLMQKIGHSWVALFYVTVLVFVLTHRQSLLSIFFRNSILRWLGLLAYGTYLIHQFILGLFFGFFFSHPPQITGVWTLLTSLLSLGITLLIARLSWRHFELPLVRIGHQLNYHFEKRHFPGSVR